MVLFELCPNNNNKKKKKKKNKNKKYAEDFMTCYSQVKRQKQVRKMSRKRRRNFVRSSDSQQLGLIITSPVKVGMRQNDERNVASLLGLQIRPVKTET